MAPHICSPCRHLCATAVIPAWARILNYLIINIPGHSSISLQRAPAHATSSYNQFPKAINNSGDGNGDGDNKYAEHDDAHSNSDTGDSGACSPVTPTGSEVSGSSSGDDESHFLQTMLRNQQNRVSWVLSNVCLNLEEDHKLYFIVWYVRLSLRFAVTLYLQMKILLHTLLVEKVIDHTRATPISWRKAETDE